MSKRVLIDELTPEEVAQYIKENETKHVRDVGLNGIKDPLVLQGAAKQGFDVVLTSEKNYFHDIGNEKQYSVGIVVLRLPEGIYPELKNLAPLAKKADEAIKLVQKGEMYQVHASGLIEKVTTRELYEREAKEKAAQRVNKGENNIRRKAEHAQWHKHRPEGVSIEEWNKEFEKRKREEFRQSRTEKEQDQIYQKKMKY